MGADPTTSPVTGEYSTVELRPQTYTNLTDFSKKCYNLYILSNFLNMDQNLENKIAELEKKIDATYESIEKVRKYMMWTAIATVAIIILPLIGLLFVIPSFISNYTEALNGLM